MPESIDLTNRRFGKLVAFDRAESRKKVTYWHCKCDCGTYSIVAYGNLIKGHTTSCGCFWEEKWPSLTAAINRITHTYKARAKKKNLEYTLTEEQVKDLFSQNCFYCDKEPSNQRKLRNRTGFIYKYSGLDKIDPNKGYTIDNVVPCCIECNQAKMDQTQEEFFDLCKRVTNKRDSKKFDLLSLIKDPSLVQELVNYGT